MTTKINWRLPLSKWVSHLSRNENELLHPITVLLKILFIFACYFPGFARYFWTFMSHFLSNMRHFIQFMLSSKHFKILRATFEVCEPLSGVCALLFKVCEPFLKNLLKIKNNYHLIHFLSTTYSFKNGISSYIVPISNY